MRLKIKLPKFLRVNLKFLSPKSLYGRFLLIILLPILLVQISGIYVSYYRNWDNITKHMARSFIKEVRLVTEIIDEMQKTLPKEELTEEKYNEILQEIKTYIELDIKYIEGHKLHTKATSDKIDLERHLSTINPFIRLDPFGRFKSELKDKFPDTKFDIVDFSEDNLMISFELETGILKILAYKKHIANPSMNSYISASLLMSLIIALISILFLKNQIRSIRNLTKAVQKLGRGQDNFVFKPSGAVEIRKAGISFLKMRKRIQNFVKQRTEMLSGISHDLRTPLTRMSLELEMMEEDENIKSLKDDVKDMEKMINEYLNFARGEGTEKFKQCSVSDIVNKVFLNYKKTNKNIELINNLKETHKINCKEKSIERVLNNVIDNGFKYGKDLVKVTLDKTQKSIKIMVEDNGKGLSNKEKQEMFKPFYKGDNARNLDVASTGLGMSIVKDIVRAHGGAITVDDSALGGLKVKIFLPM